MRVGVVVGEDGFLSETGVASDEFNVIFDLDEAQRLAKMGGRLLVWIPGSFVSTGPHTTYAELVDAAQAAIERGETYGFSISENNGLEVMLE
jgi:endonuclease IV